MGNCGSTKEDKKVQRVKRGGRKQSKSRRVPDKKQRKNSRKRRGEEVEEFQETEEVEIKHKKSRKKKVNKGQRGESEEDKMRHRRNKGGRKKKKRDVEEEEASLEDQDTWPSVSAPKEHNSRGKKGKQGKGDKARAKSAQPPQRNKQQSKNINTTRDKTKSLGRNKKGKSTDPKSMAMKGKKSGKMPDKAATEVYQRGRKKGGEEEAPKKTRRHSQEKNSKGKGKEKEQKPKNSQKVTFNKEPQKIIYHQEPENEPKRSHGLHPSINDQRRISKPGPALKHSVTSKPSQDAQYDPHESQHRGRNTWHAGQSQSGEKINKVGFKGTTQTMGNKQADAPIRHRGQGNHYDDPPTRGGPVKRGKGQKVIVKEVQFETSEDSDDFSFTAGSEVGGEKIGAQSIKDKKSMPYELMSGQNEPYMKGMKEPMEEPPRSSAGPRGRPGAPYGTNSRNEAENTPQRSNGKPKPKPLNLRGKDAPGSPSQPYPDGLKESPLKNKRAVGFKKESPLEERVGMDKLKEKKTKNWFQGGEMKPRGTGISKQGTGIKYISESDSDFRAELADAPEDATAHNKGLDQANRKDPRAHTLAFSQKVKARGSTKFLLEDDAERKKFYYNSPSTQPQKSQKPGWFNPK